MLNKPSKQVGYLSHGLDPPSRRDPFAWLNRNRRLAKDFEASIASAKAWVYIASVQLLIRRLA